MKLDLLAEVWTMMKDSIIPTDREQVANNLVLILIDNDWSAANIKAAFRGDFDVLEALKDYGDIHAEEDEDEVEYEEDEDYNDDEDEWN